MLKTDDEFLDEILKVLYKSDNREPVYVHEELSYLFDPEERYSDEVSDLSARISAELVGHNLAEGTGFGTVMRITPFGRTVYKAGGWVRYNQQLSDEKEAERRREDESHQATLDGAKSAKSSARAAWIAGLIALVPVIISVVQYIESRTNRIEINELKSRIQLLSRQLQAQKVSHKEIPTRVDSLSTDQKRKQ